MSRKNKHLDKVRLRYGHDQEPLYFIKNKNLFALRVQPGKELKQSIVHNTVLGELDNFTICELNAEDQTDKEKELDTIREHSEVAIGTHLFHMAHSDGPACVPNGEIYMKFKSLEDHLEYEKILDRFSLVVVEVRAHDEFIVQVTVDSDNPLKVAAELQKEKDVIIAEPELITSEKFNGFQLPSDDLLDRQWHLNNTGTNDGSSLYLTEGADARVVEAWEKAQTLGSQNVIVAVIDDGFDLSHPDLRGTDKIVAPFDFIRNNTDPSPNARLNDNHGTACAGVAVGNANGVGIVGAAPECSLMPIRMGRCISDRGIEKWFGHAKKNGAWVVSCSWQADGKRFKLSTRKHDAIADCAKKGRNGKGTIVCFSAGNSQRDIDRPSSYNGFATHPDVLAISASTSKDERSNYSNYGKKSIAVCAPSSGAQGRSISTSDVTGTYITADGRELPAGYETGAYTHDFGGTSSSCPLVAGICALAFSVRPSIKAKKLKSILKSTAKQIGPSTAYNSKGYSKYFGYGRIDAAAIIKELLK